ncbi:MAG: helix-turn-helix domain-containing protein, partial [Solirubrobacterales bacterium]
MAFERIQLSQETLLAAIGDDWPPEQVEAALELLANSSGKFPSGVRTLPSDLIRAIQRERLIVAMLSAAAYLGYLETNVQDVIDRAGVSRPTFYEHFSN